MVIDRKVYDIENGVRLLKTLYEDKYEDLPKDLKHEDIKEAWDKYQGIPKKLYIMSKSQDYETLELCCKILDQQNIKHFTRKGNVWDNNAYIEVLSGIDIFLNEQ